MDKPRIQYSWLQFRTKRISVVIHFLFLVVVDLCRQQSSWCYFFKNYEWFSLFLWERKKKTIGFIYMWDCELTIVFATVCCVLHSLQLLQKMEEENIVGLPLYFSLYIIKQIMKNFYNNRKRTTRLRVIMKIWTRIEINLIAIFSSISH